MSSFLIKHLNKKESEHSALGMLVNQWGFDEKLIPKALQTVGNLFPHYSRHDESHSRQILVNIERLLGNENISRLTATDTWLLLESAYWHDIGMVVPQKDIFDAQENKKFQQYIDRIRETPNHELNCFCRNFNAKNIFQCFDGMDSPIDALDKFRQLMAEWFRQQHAHRADSIIQEPWESIGISSPRTELIPARLFKLLGRICHMHGASFEDILSSGGLPYKEAGLAHEDCHPRFVACLLRMGDLLDLDDNRFCPVMQRISGENRPHISKAHEDKHAGIRHLRIDRERIEITSECSTIDGYLETFKWFDWLKQEMQQQMAHWQDIVPAREFGLLPTLGNIVVRLSGEQQLLMEGSRPQFTIDADNAIQLLQGHNLYSDKFSCIRELLQNAVDATLLKTWIEYKDKTIEWKDPFSKGIKELIKNKNIHINLTESENTLDVPTDKIRWNLQIIDQGTGISHTDLSYMSNIGGSQKNISRQKKIKEMPEWMKPSGAFGIGFQSIFMICDDVKLTTKNIFTHERLEIIMYNPTGDKEGLVLIKSLENDISHPYGTTLEIDFFLEKLGSSYSINVGSDSRETQSYQAINSYDPVLDEEFSIEAEQLADKIEIFSKNTMLTIYGKLKDREINTDISEDFAWNFLRIDNHELALKYTLTDKDRSPQRRYGMTLYRGQPFKQESFNFPFICINVNLLSGKAGEWLTVDRDELKSSAIHDFKNLVLAALEQLIKKDLKYNIDSKLSELKPLYSLFLKAMVLMGYSGGWSNLSSELPREWLELPAENQIQKTYQDFFECDYWKFTILSNINEVPANHCNLNLSNEAGELLKVIIHNEWLKDKENTIKIVDHENHARWYELKNESQDLYDDETLASHLIKAINLENNFRYIWVANSDDWEVLHLISGIKIRALLLFEISPKNPKFILLPFLFYNFHSSNLPVTVNKLDELCEWVRPNLIDKNASINNIRKAYKKLIDYIDNDIMKKSPYHDKWQKARGLAASKS